MPINVAFRDEEHFSLLGIQTSQTSSSSSPQYESTFVKHEEQIYKSPALSPRQHKKKKTVNHHVAFHQVVKVHLVLHVNDMDDEEYFDSWYQKRDLQRIHHEMKQTVVKMNNGSYYYQSGNEESSSHHKETSRGLEYRTTAGAQRRKLNKLKALRSVLSEQQRQIQRGIHDEESIRLAYLRQSHHCVKEARTLGDMDEKEAQTIHKEKTHKHRASSRSHHHRRRHYQQQQ